jgi:acetyl-CoA acetyltransferase
MRQNSKSDSRPFGPGWNPERHFAPRVSHGPARFTLSQVQADTGLGQRRRGDLAKTNVNGGAIAIGHPLGAGGVRIMTTLVNALWQRGKRYGLQTMCEGGGMANATIIERLD